MVICLELGADLHMAQLMPLPLTVSCFIKIQIGFTFLIPAHPGSPGKRAVKRVCVFKDFSSMWWSIRTPYKCQCNTYNNKKLHTKYTPAASKTHRFFSSKSALTLRRNRGNSCWSSSLTLSLSSVCLDRPAGFAKWKLLAPPCCSTTCSCTLSFVSGEIFWTAE